MHIRHSDRTAESGRRPANTMSQRKFGTELNLASKVLTELRLKKLGLLIPQKDREEMKVDEPF